MFSGFTKNGMDAMLISFFIEEIKLAMGLT